MHLSSDLLLSYLFQFRIRAHMHIMTLLRMYWDLENWHTYVAAELSHIKFPENFTLDPPPLLHYMLLHPTHHNLLYKQLQASTVFKSLQLHHWSGGGKEPSLCDEFHVTNKQTKTILHFISEHLEVYLF